MRVLVTGDREWSDKATMRAVLHALLKKHGSLTVIHGNCRGADKMADAVAREMGLDVLVFAADWASYGKAAGPIRNRQMINEGFPQLVVAFHNDLKSSRGTKDMIKASKKAGLTVLHAHSPNGNPSDLPKADGVI